MSWWIVVLLVIVVGIIAAVCAVLFSYLECKIILQVSGNHERLWVGVRMCYGLIHWRYEVKSFKLQAMNRGEWKLGLSKQEASRLSKIVWVLLDQTQIRLFAWDMELGLGEAPQTAVASGLAWSLMSFVTGIASQFFHFHTLPCLTVIPRYNEWVFSTRWVCRTRIRVLHSLPAAYMLFTQVLKKKGGFKGLRLFHIPKV